MVPEMNRAHVRDTNGRVKTDVYGKGSCSGPTGSPTKGFDCSGLVSWAVCAVTGRDLFAEGLRVTYDMYCASASKRKYE
jgi:hypothetical protein